MNYYLSVNNDKPILHYGVLGMKWGQHRAKVYENAARAARNDAKELRKAGYHTEAYAVQKVANRNHNKSLSIRKKMQQQHNAVHDYNKKYESWSKQQEKSDKKWAEVKEARMAMGKTKVSRFIAAVQNKTPEAKKYAKLYDSWEKPQDKSDSKWKATRDAYEKTGKNRVDRLLNNMAESLSNPKVHTERGNKQLIKRYSNPSDKDFVKNTIKRHNNNNI